MASYNKNTIEIASQCGTTLLKYILVVERNPVDAGYSKKKADGMLITSMPFYRYAIRPIRVTNVGVVESANETPFIVFNKPEDGLRLPLANIDTLEAIIPRPSTDSVRKAITQYEATKEPVVFTDYPALWREVDALNKETLSMMNKFINEQMLLASSLEEGNSNELTACKNAMKECGIDVTGLLP